jgi:polar amino acid transport system substrate-binding protein
MRALFVFLILSAQVVYAKEPKVYSVVLYHQANPPYSFVKEHQKEGIFIDLFHEISLLTNLKFKFVPLSVARGKLYFARGKVDIEPGISPRWRDKEEVKGVYSLSYANSKEIIMANSHKLHPVNHISQLYGKVIGKVRGYSYGDFDRHIGKNGLIVANNKSEKMLVAQLYKKRFDYILIGEASASYFINTEPKYKDFLKVYEVSNEPVSLRVHPNHQDILPVINKALDALIKSGTIAKIYAKYGYSLD